MHKIISVLFTSQGVPTEGLTPTIDIYELNLLTTTTNTLIVDDGDTIEIGGGWYRYDFLTYDPEKNYVYTFDGGATLNDFDRYKYGANESYIEEIVPAVWEEQVVSHLDTGTTGLALAQIKADTTSISTDTAAIIVSEAAITTLLNLLLKYERNRTKIDTVNAQLIIYDDDCTTPLTTFNLLDFNGMPSVQDVCQRVPTDC